MDQRRTLQPSAGRPRHFRVAWRSGRVCLANQISGRLNPDYAPATGFLNGEMAKVLDRDIAKLLEPIRRDMNQRAAAAMAPFRELMVSQTAETLKKLTPIVAEQIRLPKIPMSTSLPQQLAELAALTAPLVPGVVAEKIEEASRQVSKARGAHQRR